MASNNEKNTDNRNMGFGARVNIAHHKPGVDQGIDVHEHELKEIHGHVNHRFQQHKKKTVPQTTLAERISKPKKGE